MINFHERDNIERQRLFIVSNCHLPWEDFSDKDFLKRYRFGSESLPFIALLIEGEVRSLTRRNQGPSLNRVIILAVVVIGGFAAGRPPVFLWDCIIQEFVVFCQFGP